MKKFLNTMLATAAVVAVSTVASFADAGAKPAQGAYVGVSGGVANTNVKYTRAASGNMTNGGINGATVGNNVAAETQNVNSNSGKSAGLFGALAGYNFQSGSMVFGAEIYGGFDTTKLTVFSDAASGNSTESATMGSLTVKRTQYFGFAPRIGFMVAPNTLMYARLGVEAGAWKAQANPNLAGIAADNLTVVTPITGTDLSDTQKTVSATKKSFSFAPGAGVEVYLGKAFIRAQYSYLFGPSINLQQTMKAVNYYNGQFANHSMKVTQHKVEVAVGYKF
ncbi:MAG: hypothetical protein V4482_02785 [Pseudomonadota bacterium]